MTALQQVAFGAASDGSQGDTSRTAFTRLNSNTTILSTQDTLTSYPSVITTAIALTTAHIGQRVNINVATPTTVQVPVAATCAADQVTLLRNVGTATVTLVPTTGSGDNYNGSAHLNPGESLLIDTDGVHAWNTLMRGRPNSDNETVNGNSAVVGNETVGGTLTVVGALSSSSLSTTGNATVGGALVVGAGGTLSGTFTGKPNLSGGALVTTLPPGTATADAASCAFVGATLALPLANRNYIVDGNFDYWVAGSVTTAAGGVTNNASPMYYNYAGASGVATVTENFFYGTEPVGMTSPALKYMKHAQTTASTGTVAAYTCPIISQHIESVQTLQGRPSTFSCWLWVDSGSITIPAIYQNQYFGSGGSPATPEINALPVSWGVTTTPQRFSLLVNWASTASKTLGTGGNDCIEIGICLPPGVAFNLNTTQWQLEQSPANVSSTSGLPTSFEYRGLQAEIARLQRYYEASAQGYAIFWSGATTSGSPYYVTSRFVVTKRAAPTITYPNPTYDNFSSLVLNGGAIDVSSFNTSCVANATSNSSWFASNFIADARL